MVLERFQPSHVVFAGVAGAIGAGVDIGDIVVADRLAQHDFDASPIFARYVIPSLGVAEIATDPVLTKRLVDAVARFSRSPAAVTVATESGGMFHPSSVQVHTGLVASGDRFIDDTAEARTLRGALPELLAVEMEGAAVAQVCAERLVPFAVFRSISDRADQKAEVDFLAFIATVAAPLTAGIVAELLSDFS